MFRSLRRVLHQGRENFMAVMMQWTEPINIPSALCFIVLQTSNFTITYTDGVNTVIATDATRFVFHLPARLWLCDHPLFVTNPI